MQNKNDGWAFSSHADPAADWPKLADGTPEEAVFLDNLPEVGGIADMTVMQLRACGIPVLKKFRTDGGSRVVMGFSGFGTDLYVPASRLEEAKALMEADLSESVDDGSGNP